ncbi:MAG: hypothetical protein HY514_01335 [Candidatus Aenigmarchaeota archaeon]|nr:hypothetical protein [Candidatus Aenigmarchaeota archaeon]
MRKEKHYSLIKNDIRIDVRFIKEKKRIVHFAINVALLIDGKAEDVFRIDTAHKGLHVMRFWISTKLKYLENKRKDDYRYEFNKWKKEVIENFEKWAEIYRRTKEGGKYE